MFVQVVAGLFGCTPEEDSFSSVASHETPQPSSEPYPDTSVEDTANSVFAGPCPDGLVPVPPVDPVYCIMAYEARVPDSGVGAVSEAGVLPSANISLLNAEERCAQTPVRINGETIGNLRLASLSEWRDAGDGIVAEGGTLFPWGDEHHTDQCVMGSGYEDFQHTGSMERCRSVFGVYDQIGNIWEWVSTEAVADQAAWVQQQAQLGLSISIVEERLISNGPSENLVIWLPLAVGLNYESFLVSTDGEVYLVGSTQGDRTSVDGYLGSHELIGRDGGPATGDLLPVSIDFTADPALGRILIPSTRDGEKIGVKVGGAYYSGWDSTLKSIFYGHVPEFNGTIGFRCVSDPIALD